MEQPENKDIKNTKPEEETDVLFSDEVFEHEKHLGGSSIMLLLPLLLSIYFFLGFTNVDTKKRTVNRNNPENITDSKDDKSPKVNFSALLAPEEFSKNLRDTVFTNGDLWLELRIDQQTLYAHHRNGVTTKYLVSTGNPNVSKSVESRPGLYAIFLKEEVHLSSQFNNARMNYYMPYNMGIGFHGLPGTGYYGHLGVRPSSHGCIRMRNEDVRVLFGQSKVGTLVLSHKGNSTRVVAFAPRDFENNIEYTKEDYINMLAYNLSSIMEGKYFTHPPKKFVLDGTIVPRSGINVNSVDNLPEKQMLPYAVAKIELNPDKLSYDTKNIIAKDTKDIEYVSGLFEFSDTDSVSTSSPELSVDPETVKRYAHNPLGILPYFPPNR